MAPVPEYMRIRAYIINYINDPNRESAMIPAENELCRLFNVTRPTVRNAIKGLVKDNYLIPRRGMGTYINPNKAEVDTLSSVAVIRGDGHHVTTPFSHEIAKILEMNGMSVQPIYLMNSDDPQRLVEIVRNGIECVIWEQPRGQEKMISELKKNGIPQLVVAYHPCDGCDNLIYSTSIGESLADFLYENGHENMLFTHTDNNADAHFCKGSWLERYCRRMSALTGREIKTTDCFCPKDSIQEKLKAIKDGYADYSVIYTMAKNVPQLSQLCYRENIVVPDDVSLITYGEAEARYFNQNSCCYVDIFNPLKDEFFKWHLKRNLKKDLSGLINKELEAIIKKGRTLKMINEVMV